MFKKLVNRIDSILVVISRIFGFIAIAAVVVMMVMIVCDVFLRYTFNSPILGVVELTEIMMVSMGFLAVVYTTVKNTHIKVEVMTNILPDISKFFLDGLFFIVTIVVLFIIARQNMLETMEVMQRGKGTTLLDIPVFPFYSIISIGCGLVAIILFVRLVQHIIKAVERWN
jgi:TRAP-type C4-dicarboxylate transport system permease small subunit